MTKNKAQKVFCIGANKTGTTSFEAAMKDLGFKMPEQKDFEILFDDWVKRDFSRVVKEVKKYDAFQDVPFSLPFTFIALDQAFPNSKFVLTIRDTEKDWYDSIVSFHANMWGSGGRIPTREDLRSAFYHYKGRPDYTNRHIFQSPNDDPYHLDTLLKFYNTHNENVLNYFKFRPRDLLILNVADDDSYMKLCEFVEREPIYSNFPWKNKT